jgi:diguanylate cyclase (GGDEF)-like protein
MLAMALVILVRTGIDLGKWPGWAAGSAAIAIASLSNARAATLRVGGQQWHLSWSEAAVVLILVLVPTDWAVVFVGLGAGITELYERRPLQKLLFNCSLAVVAIFVARSIYAFFGDAQLGRELVGLGVAATIYCFIGQAAISLIMATVRRSSWLRFFVAGLPMSGLVLPGNLLLAFAVILLARYSPLTLALTPLVIICLVAVYRHSVRTKVESALWQKLDEVDLAGAQLDETEVVTKATSAARDLFRAETAELVFDPAIDESAPGIVVEPVPGPDGQLGILRMTLDGTAELTGVERRVLIRFAHGIGSAVINARLHGETRELAERNAYQATHDDLTGLANRPELQRQVETLIDSKQSIALLILDLKHVKEVNETLGLAAGDMLLCQIADTLRRSVRPDDIVARCGGDEFAVVLTRLSDPSAAEVVALSLLEALGAPVDVEGLQLTVEATVGLACAPDDASSGSELMQRAHVALQLAQASDRDCERWTAERDPSSLDKLALLAELKQALTDDELVLHYQPKTDMPTGVMVGCEVLVRWQHPRRGLLAPGAFIPAVETSGLVHAFTLAVLDKALAQQAKWVRDWPGSTMAVNLSARNLLDRTLPQAVAKLLARHGVAASKLVLEITETSMMRELEVVEGVLSELRDLGVQLSVDDFGTGFSSLTFLQRVAVNEIKIDRAFVDRMLDVESDRTIVRATIDLAHGLGIRVVAEGVEVVEQLDALRTLGCDQVQGYFLARPMPPEQMMDVVRASRNVTNVVPLQKGRARRATERASGDA